MSSSSSSTNKCAVCGKTDGLMACSRCKTTMYCSAQHQREDWKRHKPLCKAPSAAKPSQPTDVIASMAAAALANVKDVSALLKEDDTIPAGGFVGDSAEGRKREWTIAEVEDAITKGSWRNKGKEYWRTSPATVDGMLGGFESVDKADIADTKLVLGQLLTGKIDTVPGLRAPVLPRRAVDCGAGIGRVTRYALAKYFDKVDIVEQDEHLIKASEKYLREVEARVGKRVCVGLQDFDPAGVVADGEAGCGGYDLIWIQWVVLYLSDTEYVEFLKRCKEALNKSSKGSVIVVKDNITHTNRFWVDMQDGSIIRSDLHMRTIFKRAGLKLVASRKQPDLPKNLFPVKTYILE